MSRRGLEALILAGAALAALGISVYLTVSHYTAVPLVCAPGGILDCGSVVQSAYSVIPGTSVPVTIPGMVWAAGSLVVALLGARRAGGARLWAPLHFAWSAVALGAVLYFVFVELVLLHRVCEWCTAFHVLVVVTFLLTLARLQRAPDAATGPAVGTALTAG